MRWAIEIQDTALELRNLDELLSGLGFSLINDIEFRAFTSPDFDACDTAAAVFEKAKGVRAAFTGPAQIDPRFSLGSVIDYSLKPPKRHTFIEVPTVALNVTVGSPTISVSPPAGLSDGQLQKWRAEDAERQYQEKLEAQRAKLEPAFRNKKAVKVLELLSTEKPSGETIYKIYELMEGHPNNRSDFHRQFGITRDDFSRFKDAVHNPTVSGDWARHAYEGPPKSSDPMTKGEAETFVRRIATRWLGHLRATSR
jgi:hypothetical protein